MDDNKNSEMGNTPDPQEDDLIDSNTAVGDDPTPEPDDDSTGPDMPTGDDPDPTEPDDLTEGNWLARLTELGGKLGAGEAADALHTLTGEAGVGTSTEDTPRADRDAKFGADDAVRAVVDAVETNALDDDGYLNQAAERAADWQASTSPDYGRTFDESAFLQDAYGSETLFYTYGSETPALGDHQETVLEEQVLAGLADDQAYDAFTPDMAARFEPDQYKKLTSMAKGQDGFEATDAEAVDSMSAVVGHRAATYQVLQGLEAEADERHGKLEERERSMQDKGADIDNIQAEKNDWAAERDKTQDDQETLVDATADQIDQFYNEHVQLGERIVDYEEEFEAVFGNNELLDEIALNFMYQSNDLHTESGDSYKVEDVVSDDNLDKLYDVLQDKKSTIEELAENAVEAANSYTDVDEALGQHDDFYDAVEAESDALDTYETDVERAENVGLIEATDDGYVQGGSVDMVLNHIEEVESLDDEAVEEAYEAVSDLQGF